MSPDRIILEGLRFYAYHGANAEEQTRGQPFVVDVEVELELATPGRSDRLGDTTSYTHVYRVVQEVMLGPNHNLLESLAETIARRLLEAFAIDGVRVKVTKTAPPVKGAILSGVAVEIHRQARK